MNFEIANEESDGFKYAVITSRVEKLDTNVAPELKAQLVQLNTQGTENIIIDLSDTRYCDSSGLSSILVASRLCKNAEGIFVLTGLQEPVMKLITISQLHSVLNIVPTVSEAVDFLMMEKVSKDLGGEG